MKLISYSAARIGYNGDGWRAHAHVPMNMCMHMHMQGVRDEWRVHVHVPMSMWGGEAEVRMGEVRRMEREALEARLGRGGYVVGAMWDEGSAVHAMRRFGGTTLAWRFGDG